MQDNSTKRILYGMLMILIFIILIGVTIYIPLLGGLTMLFIPLPIILFRLDYGRIPSLLLLTIGLLISIVIGGVIAALIALIFGLIGFIIGDTVSQKNTKLYTFMSTGLTLLISLVLTYVAVVLIFKVNVIESLMSGLRDSQERATKLLVQYGELPENFQTQMNDLIAFYELAMPSFIIIMAFILAFVIVVLNLFIVKKLGHNPPKFPAFRTMKLPVVLLWCYLVVVLVPFLAPPTQGSTMELTVVNASVILRFLFLIQGISFIHYSINKAKLSKWLLVISTMFALLVSQLTILIGILDVGMNIRAWIGRNKSK